MSVIVGACRRSRSRIHGRGLWIMDHGRRNKMEDFGVGELLGYRMIILGQKQLQKVKKSKSFIRVPCLFFFLAGEKELGAYNPLPIGSRRFDWHPYRPRQQTKPVRPNTTRAREKPLIFACVLRWIFSSLRMNSI